MPSFRHTAALTSAALLALASATSAKAQCPQRGYRFTTASTDRFSGIKTIHSHFPPAYKIGRVPP